MAMAMRASACCCGGLLLFFFLGAIAAANASHPLAFIHAQQMAAGTQQPQPYRTAFHFQPPDNWMNDPNGPMFYKGYYHLFYQWNPFAAVWGNITWGHAVSTDMVHWKLLELALVPDQWYDLYGCWSGSVTFLAKDKPAILYTGWSNVSYSTDNQVQMQAMAVPADYSDPLLRKWVKVPENPILQAPAGINSTKFRDPTTAWIGADGRWRLVVGARRNRKRGLALLYRSSDFINWEKAKHPLHTALTGMWECPDFYPVPLFGTNGLDTSANGGGVKHVLKVSLDNDKHDYYTVGTYVPSSDSFIPATASFDAGIGLRYDYGKYYASKTFFDDKKGRRILLGWVNESTPNTTDIQQGWSSLQAFPRKVWLDDETRDSLLQWPIEEVETLRKDKVSLKGVELKRGSVLEVKGVKGNQLDVEVTFEVPSDLSQAENADVDNGNVQLICSQKGVSRNGVLGPFGLLVLASATQSEQTAVFFYIVSNGGGGWDALVCSDQSRSSLLTTDLDKTTYGSFVALTGKNLKTLSLRALVDHSMVETFAQGGKVCITSRVYPRDAIGDNAHLFLFNNGTTAVHVQSLEAWEMETVTIEAF